MLKRKNSNFFEVLVPYTSEPLFLLSRPDGGVVFVNQNGRSFQFEIERSEDGVDVVMITSDDNKTVLFRGVERDAARILSDVEGGLKNSVLNNTWTKKKKKYVLFSTSILVSVIFGFMLGFDAGHNGDWFENHRDGYDYHQFENGNSGDWNSSGIPSYMDKGWSNGPGPYLKDNIQPMSPPNFGPEMPFGDRTPSGSMPQQQAMPQQGLGIGPSPENVEDLQTSAPSTPDVQTEAELKSVPVLPQIPSIGTFEVPQAEDIVLPDLDSLSSQSEEEVGTEPSSVESTNGIRSGFVPEEISSEDNGSGDKKSAMEVVIPALDDIKKELGEDEALRARLSANELVVAKMENGEKVPQSILELLPPDIAENIKNSGLADESETSFSMGIEVKKALETLRGQQKDDYGISALPSPTSQLAIGGKVVLPLPGGGDIESTLDLEGFGLYESLQEDIDPEKAIEMRKQ